MRKCQIPERVSLPDARTFLARNEHVTRDHLPPNARMRQRYKQRGASKGRGQGGQGMGSVFRFATKKKKNLMVRNLTKWPYKNSLVFMKKG